MGELRLGGKGKYEVVRESGGRAEQVLGEGAVGKVTVGKGMGRADFARHGQPANVGITLCR